MTDRSPAAMRWVPSSATAAAIIAGGVIIVVGLAAGRPDLCCLAVPLLVWAAWHLSRPPQPTDTTMRISVPEARADEDIPFTVHIDDACPAAFASLHLRTAGRDQHTVVVPITRTGTGTVHGSTTPLHSGPLSLVRAQFRLATADAAFVGEPSSPAERTYLVPSTPVPLRQLLLPRRLRGLAGAHESSRPGDGGEFRDIHPFAAGDRLRRVDWKATARLGRRPGDLFVRRTSATSDASVLIVIDTSDDLGEVVSDWSTGDPLRSGVTSMDLAREAAGALASAYTAQGDQVAFNDLGIGGRYVRGGSGDRHRARLLSAIAATRGRGSSRLRRRAPRLAPGGIVFLLSTFMGEEATRLAVLWATTGSRVIAVDVLPEPDRTGLDLEDRMALRIVLMERDDRLRMVTASGAEILRWVQDRPGARAARLLALSRVRRR